MHFGCNLKISRLNIYILIFIVFNSHKLLAQDLSKSLSNKICSLSQNCGQCISNPSCAWCSSNTFTTGGSRCDSYINLLSIGCAANDIIYPNSSVEIVENKVEIKENEPPILLHPQKFKLHIRKNDVQKITIIYEQPYNYPIDLYYLMDLSYSMKDHKDKLVELADSLVANMNNITKIFRLGFGSFIDKVVMPYANMIPIFLENPCLYTRNIKCAPPYGFRNHLSLNDNISQFGQVVSSTPISGNLDPPEGGFDAIMQVIRCRNHIKWNDISRKIILFATDSPFHYAGDGKLGGIVKPNDGECHLNKEGYYTESIFQDYPSLEQINRVVSDSKINMIFAVPEEMINVYKKLSEHIPRSTYGVLKHDSSNIVDLIRENFEKFNERVELRDNSSEAVQIKYISRCLSSNNSETNSCDNIGIGQTVEFDVEIVVTECPPNQMERIVFTPIGINEYTIVDLHVFCECECESESKPNCSECSYSGTHACGVCSCNSNRFGRNCECSGDDAFRPDLLNQCKRNKSGTVLCSNRGQCVCGQCDCHSKQNTGDIISGDYCECDTFSCGRDVSGLSCGGPQKGHCCDGECLCTDGWSGPICECSTRNTTCLRTDQSEKLCSGHGVCRCGKCRCSEGYYGEHCQDCAYCEGKCDELQLCVECKVFKSGIYSPLECSNKCGFEYKISQTYEYLKNARKCIYDDREGCRISFDYKYRKGNQILIRVIEKECSAIFTVYVFYVSIALIVFLIGLLALFIFRLYIWYKDRQEFQRYAAEVEKSKPQLELKEENPIFKSAQTNHINPTYLEIS